MAHERGADREAGHFDAALVEIVQVQIARQLLQSHGEQRWRHVSRQARVEIGGRGTRSPDVHFEVGTEQWREESEALDVIHMEVREQHVDAAHVGRQLDTQSAQTRARVEHDARVGVRARLELHARCVAAVTDRVGSR